VGEAADGSAALRTIETLAPDLVFLDIQMPEMSGFEVLARLARRPRIIFATAHDEFAVRAFEEQALDYLLKPIEPARLARALSRLGEPVEARLDRLLEAVERGHARPGRIAVRQGTRIALVDPATVVFVRAEDKYSVLHTADREHVLDKTLEELQRTLDPDVFVRIHRSAIININFVKDLAAEDGRYLVTLADPPSTRIYASRSGARALRERLRL
jgi:two-component system LytT family response regulator